MAELKKISELKPSQVNENTEFLLIDKSLGKTNKISFSSLKDYLEKTGEPGSIGDSGDKGLKGSRGPKGFAGMSGTEGRKGFPGREGDSGDPGAKGSKGFKGPKGTKGSRISSSELASFRGPVGDVGEKGQGIAGKPGDKGSQVTGSLGDKGNTGFPGENQPKGVKGQKGHKGVAGRPGDSGSRALSADRGDKGPSGQNSTARGDKGPLGPNGAGGSRSQHKFSFYKSDSLDENLYGFTFTEGSTYPRYTNDNFNHINGGGAVMRGTQNRFQKIGPSGWNAGLKSRQTRSTNSGVFSLTIVPHVTYQQTMWGLSLNPGAHYNTLDYAFYFNTSTVLGHGTLTIYEKGVQQKYGDWAGQTYGISPTTTFIYLYQPGMQYHIDWDGVNKQIIYRVADSKTGEPWVARKIDCPWASKNVYAGASFHLGVTQDKVDATRYVLWR